MIVFVDNLDCPFVERRNHKFGQILIKDFGGTSDPGLYFR